MSGHATPQRVESRTVVAHDTSTLTPTATGGTELTYRAVSSVKRFAGLVAPLAAPARRLGDESETGLREAHG